MSGQTGTILYSHLFYFHQTVCCTKQLRAQLANAHLFVFFALIANYFFELSDIGMIIFFQAEYYFSVW